jgi:polygalacturonase
MAALAPKKPARPARPFYSVLDYGAVGDGKVLCTSAIQKAVDTCASEGGGNVIVPAGRYLTGPIFLKSNLRVEVLAGATLLFTTDFDTVPAIDGRWEGVDGTVYASLFTGNNLDNVSLTGRGTLDGQGETWWKAFRVVREMRKKLSIEGEREVENPPGSPLKWGRPRMINLYRSRNILISGLNIVDSPSWNIHPVLCQNICIDGVTITAPADSPNTDGIDPDSCKDVRIANCYVSVGDDCIIIKSGYRYQAQGTPSEDITVTNCAFGTGHAGVGIGSETAGGVKNVTVSNCVCDGTERGLRIKTARGRGNVVENVRASSFLIRHAREAVSVTMFYSGGDRHAPQPVSESTPVIRNLHFSGIIATGVKRAALIEGLPEMPIQGISLSDVVVDDAANGMTCTNATGAVFDNVVVNAEEGPALHVDDAREVELYRFTTRKPRPGEPVVRLENVKDAVIQSCTAAEGTGTFLELKGPGTRDISLLGNRLARAAREVGFTGGATEDAIVKRP